MTSDRWEPAAFKARVDEVLHRFVAQEAEQFAAIDPVLGPVAEQLEAAVADGKRLRAAFCYWGWRAAGQPDSDALVRAAASMELVHAAAVVHDDLIDDSAAAARARPRRTSRCAVPCGVPESATPPRRSLAMLVGDLLMSLAGQLFATCGLPAAYLARARPLWSVLARELIAGECLEILRTGAESGHRGVAEGDPVQDRQVHRRAAPADRRRPGRGGRAAARGLLRVRAAAGRGVPAPGRPARPVRRPGDAPARPMPTMCAASGPRPCWRRPGASPATASGSS